MAIDSVVTDWITIDYTEAYCADSKSGFTTIIFTCLRNALTKVDSLVNFNDFDVDGDRMIDAIDNNINFIQVTKYYNHQFCFQPMTILLIFLPQARDILPPYYLPPMSLNPRIT